MGNNNRIDMVGAKIGKLTVIKLSEKRGRNKKRIYWECKCECGNTKDIAADCLRRKNFTVSCGCIRKNLIIKPRNSYKSKNNPDKLPRKNLVGQIFYPWKVLELIGRKAFSFKSKAGFTQWIYVYKVKCLNCGIELNKNRNDLYCASKYKCRNCKCREKGLGGLKRLYSSYNKGATSRNLIFNLTIEQFKYLTSQKCFYCGREPSQICQIKSKKGCCKTSTWSDYLYNGIDRKNNENGYLFDNCLPCCKICNKAKCTMSFQDFCDYIKLICENFQKKSIPLLYPYHLTGDDAGAGLDAFGETPPPP